MKTNKIQLAAVLGLAMSFHSASAAMFDLSAPGTQTVNIDGDYGGVAVVSDYFEQPTGTGVFQPFLTIDSNGQTSTGDKRVEQGYNTDGFTSMYLDELRPQWNNYLKVGDLADITINNILYYAFILDANEPGGDKDLISIDNMRIYTSSSDNTASVGDDITKLDNLGTLRWAMNNPLLANPTTFDIDQWIKLDASQENVEQGASNSNGGSGKGDMVVYIPQSDFAGALDTDYVWFYNLNGVNFTADKDLAAESGYEEWRAVVSLQSDPPDNSKVPDGGSTVLILGLSLLGLGGARKCFSKLS